jgi:hypothetical protein
MNANGFSQGDYENEARFQTRRKQTQFKPNFKIPDRIRSLSSSENAYTPPKKMAQNAKNLTSVVF